MHGDASFVPFSAAKVGEWHFPEKFKPHTKKIRKFLAKSPYPDAVIATTSYITNIKHIFRSYRPVLKV